MHRGRKSGTTANVCSFGVHFREGDFAAIGGVMELFSLCLCCRLDEAEEDESDEE